MTYQVLARKYRPQTFAEVVGQEPVVTALSNALREGRVGHAYLFSGTRGVGKTTTARLLAKALNCARGPAADPCGACDSCREVAAGGALDVIEIDGASNRLVEDAEEIRQNVQYRPARDRYKVVIIDEVHMLSGHAFNALLKTLEEPPPHVVFILATTELRKIPPTIFSRCQHYEFRRIPARRIAEHLRRIARQEEVEVEDGALHLVARRGAGSLRDAQSLFDRVLASCGKKVTESGAADLLGFSGSAALSEFASRALEGDAAGALTVADRLLERGADPVQVHREILEHLRALLIARLHPDPASILDASPEEVADWASLAGNFQPEELSRALRVFLDGERGIAFAAEPRFLLEADTVRIASLRRLASIEEVLRALGTGEPLPAGPPASANPSSRPEGDAAPPAQAPSSPAPAAGGSDEARFGEILERIPPGMLRTNLSHARIRRDGARLVLEFPDAYSERSVSRPDSLEQVRSAARAVLGPDTEIAVRKAGGGSGAGSREAAPARTAKAVPRDSGGGLQTLLDVFDGRVVDPRGPASSGEESD